MGPRPKPHCRLIHLVCILPLVVAVVLALAGVPVHPLVGPLLLVLCCLLMFTLMSGMLGNAAECAHGAAEQPPETPPELPSAAAAWEERTGDVFRVRHVRRTGLGLILEGDLLVEPDDAYRVLHSWWEGTGITPLLQEAADGVPVVVLVSRAFAPGGGTGAWLNAVLLALTLATTTCVGAAHAGVDLLKEPGRFTAGLPYAVALLLILGVHELGHYLAARAHGMPCQPAVLHPGPVRPGHVRGVHPAPLPGRGPSGAV